MGFLQKLFSPLGYIGAVILASLGLAPVNATQWVSLPCFLGGHFLGTKRKRAVGLPGCWSAYFPWDVS
jgi:hypothetical protein